MLYPSNTNFPTQTPSIQEMVYSQASGRENRPGGGPSAAARSVAAVLVQSGVTKAIEAKYNAIKSEQCHGVRPQTRLDLGKFLVDEGITNPGGLSPQKENVCTWTMLEYVAAIQTRTLSFRQLQSFAKTPEQMNNAIHIIRQLGLTADRFIA